MKAYEAFFTGLGLAMDAFAISVLCSIYNKNYSYARQFLPAVLFVTFQSVMLILGCFFGKTLNGYLRTANSLISAFILAVIGIKMIFEQDQKHGIINDNKFGISTKHMLVLAFATSIDAFAAGIAISLKEQYGYFYKASFIVGAVTFVLCLFGIYYGKNFAKRFDKYGTFFGGCILILMGIKTALEAFGVNKLIFEI